MTDVDMNEESFTTKPSSSFWRWTRRIFWGLLILLILFMGAYWRHSERLKSQLREAIAKQDRDEPGWRWKAIQDSRKVIPPHENAALEVLDLYRRFPKMSYDLSRLDEQPMLPH